MTQNRSTAVMQRRVEPHDSLDDFPTPPWATRALCEFIDHQGIDLSGMICREPAANRGHDQAALQVLVDPARRMTPQLSQSAAFTSTTPSVDAPATSFSRAIVSMALRFTATMSFSNCGPTPAPQKRRIRSAFTRTIIPPTAEVSSSYSKSLKSFMAAGRLARVAVPTPHERGAETARKRRIEKMRAHRLALEASMGR